MRGILVLFCQVRAGGMKRSKRLFRDSSKVLVGGAVTFLLLAIPWIVYQRALNELPTNERSAGIRFQRPAAAGDLRVCEVAVDGGG